MSLELEERLKALEIELEKYKNSGYWTRRDVLKGIGLTGIGLLGLSHIPNARASDLSFDLSGTTPKLTSNLDFNYYKAITLTCDNGTTFPASPVLATWFLHTPTGRKILYMYDGSTWIPITSVGAITVYVDYTDGTDDQVHGSGVDTNAYKTINYATSQIPLNPGGNVVVNLNGETHYITATTIAGFYPTGSYSLTFQGVTQTTVTTGTATSGSARTVVKTGAGWGVNAYQDMWVSITAGTGSGQIRPIRSNTADTLTTAPFGTAPDNTSVFSILDNVTIISGATSGAPTTPSVNTLFTFKNIFGAGVVFSKISFIYATTIDISIQGAAVLNTQDCKFTGRTNQTDYGIHVNLISGINLLMQRTIFKLFYIGLNLTGQCAAYVDSCLFRAQNNVGIRNDAFSYVYAPRTNIDSSSVDGVLIREMSLFEANNTDLTNNGGWGVNTTTKSLGFYVSTAYYSGNVSGTYTADASSTNI